MWAVAHPDPPGVDRRFDQLRVRLYGDTAIANGIVVITGAGGGERRSVFTDVFVRRDGRWQAVNAQENAVPRAG
jgi:ketosteroid isomerase-like protein